LHNIKTLFLNINQLNQYKIIAQFNDWGKQKRAFFFCIDFEMKQCIAYPADEIDNRLLLFNFNGKSNENADSIFKNALINSKKPVDFQKYEKAFHTVKSELHHGNSYLLNLTFPTEITINGSLKDIYYSARAKFKVLYKNEFVFFSPETFAEIKDQKIIVHPMKGTIDASLENAEQRILTNTKEMAEHATIVDLLRNDLSMVAENVKVSDYRYLTHLKTTGKNLIQVSSAIAGDLPPDYHKNIGDIIFRMLPAGSVSGAPKEKTVQIIRSVEKSERGFFTGISGFFDGQNLDSCVNIRFIENLNGKYLYRSGGGITIHSRAEDEYNEMIDKVYVPIA